jgi:gamma-aminobutyric acid type B receptor
LQGSVAFSEETGDRIAWTKIEQLQNKKYEVVAFYDQKTDNVTWLPPPMYYGGTTTLENASQAKDRVIWLGGKIPQDRTIVKHHLKKLNIWLYASMVTIALVGVVIACLLVYFNFRYGHRRIIQHSHPSCNNLMLVGIMICLLAIIPLGLDGRFVSPSVFPLACGGGMWLLTLGFSLAYGAMFSKIWRVHRLATKSKSDTKTVSFILLQLFRRLQFLGASKVADVINLCETSPPAIATAAAAGRDIMRLLHVRNPNDICAKMDQQPHCLIS